MTTEALDRKDVRTGVHTPVMGLCKEVPVPFCPSGSPGICAMPDPTCAGRGAAFTGAAPTKDKSFAGCARGTGGPSNQ